MEERLDSPDRGRCPLTDIDDQHHSFHSNSSLTPRSDLAPRGFAAPGTVWMLLGGLVGAVGAYLFQLVGSRSVGSEEFAPVGVLWTLLFIVGTVLLIPLEQYVTRQVSLGRWNWSTEWKVLVGVVGLSAAVGSVIVFITRSEFFADQLVFGVQAVLLFLGHGVMYVVRGYLAGSRRFATVGWLLTSESLIRLGAAVLLLAISPESALALGWAMVLAPIALLTFSWRKQDRVQLPYASSSTPVTIDPSPLRFLTSYIVGSAAAILLLGGAPLAVAALGGGATAVSVVFVTFTLFRGPLTLIYSLQGRLLPMLVKAASQSGPQLITVWVRRIVGVGLGLVCLGVGLGWWVGPPLVELLFSAEFRPDPVMTALAAGGMIAAAAAQIGGQTLVALGRTGQLALVWNLGLLVSLILLPLAPTDPETAVGVAFFGGAVTVLVGLLFYRNSRPVQSVVT